MMSVAEIVIWTFVFIIATGFVTVVSTTVLIGRAKKRAEKEVEQPTKQQPEQDTRDDWEKGDWSQDDWKKGDWK